MLSFSVSLLLLSSFCLPQNHFRLTLSSLQHHISLISIAISANRSLFLLYMSKSLFSVMPFHHLPFPLFSESSVILFSFPFWTLNLLRESFRLPWLSTKANIHAMEVNLWNAEENGTHFDCKTLSHSLLFITVMLTVRTSFTLHRQQLREVAGK